MAVYVLLIVLTREGERIMYFVVAVLLTFQSIEHFSQSGRIAGIMVNNIGSRKRPTNHQVSIGNSIQQIEEINYTKYFSVILVGTNQIYIFSFSQESYFSLSGIWINQILPHFLNMIFLPYYAIR